MAGPIVDEVYPHTATAVHCVVTLLCLIIAAWLAGTSVLMLALPPYISAEEEQILLDVLKEFPEGVPTADGGGQPTVDPPVVEALEAFMRACYSAPALAAKRQLELPSDDPALRRFAPAAST